MATWLVWVVTAIYGCVAIDLLIKRDFGHSLMFFGYSIANIGLVWALSK